MMVDKVIKIAIAIVGCVAVVCSPCDTVHSLKKRVAFCPDAPILLHIGQPVDVTRLLAIITKANIRDCGLWIIRIKNLMQN